MPTVPHIVRASACAHQPNRENAAMWAELYERAARTPRPELVAALAQLDHLDVQGLRSVWAELGFRVRWPGRGAAVERIRRRVLDRHDTAERVRIGLTV